MATEKTFSRINAGKSMLFLGRFIRCAQHPGPKALLTVSCNFPVLGWLRMERAAASQRIWYLTLYFERLNWPTSARGGGADTAVNSAQAGQTRFGLSNGVGRLRAAFRNSNCLFLGTAKSAKLGMVRIGLF